jgi:ParB-like chromosome segregation protein Spo0J
MSTTTAKATIKLPPFHRLASIFPPMTEQEFNDLVADIDRHGQRDPVDLWNGEIIEGVHRAKACQKLGIEPRYRQCKFELNEAGALAYVISKNLHRRHLNTEQKRDLIRKLLEAAPGKTDNQIAKEVKASHHTVKSVRGEKPNWQNANKPRVEASGRKARGRKPGEPAKKPAPAKKQDSTPSPASAPAPTPEPSKQTMPLTGAAAIAAINAEINKDEVSKEQQPAPAPAPDNFGFLQAVVVTDFAAHTIRNFNSGHLKFSGDSDPERLRKWHDLKDRAEPLIQGALK